MAKRFCGNDFALVKVAKGCSSSARIVTADTATAAPHAANRPVSSSGGAPTGATNRVAKGDSIIVTASVNTGAAAVNSKRV